MRASFRGVAAATSKVNRSPRACSSFHFRSVQSGSFTPPWDQADSSPVIDAAWASEHVDQIKVIDASWSIGQKEQPEPAVSGAVPFNIDEVAWKDTWLPHMLPSEKEFEMHMNRLGVTNSDYVVVGDRSAGMFVASARVWWMFRVFGHDKVKVLSGGFSDWPEGLHANRATNGSGAFQAKYRPDLVKEKYDVKEIVEKGDASQTIVDARSKARFYAQEPEPRPDVPSGSIPESLNIPFTELLFTDDDGVFRLHDVKTLRSVLKDKPYDITRPITTSCGTGVTACVLALGYYAIGKKRVSVYDGSWTEYGMDETLPKVVRRDPEHIKDAIARGDVRPNKLL